MNHYRDKHNRKLQGYGQFISVQELIAEKLQIQNTDSLEASILLRELNWQHILILRLFRIQGLQLQ